METVREKIKMATTMMMQFHVVINFIKLEILDKFSLRIVIMNVFNKIGVKFTDIVLAISSNISATSVVVLPSP